MTWHTPSIKYPNPPPPTPPQIPFSLIKLCFRPSHAFHQQLSPLTLRRHLSPLTLRNQSSPLTLRRHLSPLTLRHQSSPLTLRRHLSPLTLRHQSSSLTLRRQLSPLTLRRHLSPLSLRDQFSQLTFPLFCHHSPSAISSHIAIDVFVRQAVVSARRESVDARIRASGRQQ